MKAFIFDPLWDELITDRLLATLKRSGLELIVTKEVAPLSTCTVLFEGDEPRLLCINPDYVGWKLSSNDYKDIPNLKAILGAATSFSWIDTSYADQNNIPVCNIRDFSTQAVAEWAILMMFNLARQMPRLIKDEFPLDFDKDFMKYRGIELKGKTAGIVGLGRIGDAIAERAKGLGMNVVYWSKSQKQSDYQYKELADLFNTADVIFPTLAINDETKKLITAELLASMKSLAILVTVVHGLFDEQVAIDLVKRGSLFGFGFEAEPASFQKYEGNVWAAPAYAWATDGSMSNSMTKWVENMVNAAQGLFPNKVN
jgi:lactate dehydrogenase-like 2-hydroxyacid dehydrogenase